MHAWSNGYGVSWRMIHCKNTQTYSTSPLKVCTAGTNRASERASERTEKGKERMREWSNSICERRRECMYVSVFFLHCVRIHTFELAGWLAGVLRERMCMFGWCWCYSLRLRQLVFNWQPNDSCFCVVRSSPFFCFVIWSKKTRSISFVIYNFGWS